MKRVKAQGNSHGEDKQPVFTKNKSTPGITGKQTHTRLHVCKRTSTDIPTHTCMQTRKTLATGQREVCWPGGGCWCRSAGRCRRRCTAPWWTSLPAAASPSGPASLPPPPPPSPAQQYPHRVTQLVWSCPYCHIAQPVWSCPYCHITQLVWSCPYCHIAQLVSSVSICHVTQPVWLCLYCHITQSVCLLSNHSTGLIVTTTTVVIFLALYLNEGEHTAFSNINHVPSTTSLGSPNQCPFCHNTQLKRHQHPSPSTDL